MQCDSHFVSEEKASKNLRFGSYRRVCIETQVLLTPKPMAVRAEDIWRQAQCQTHNPDRKAPKGRERLPEPTPTVICGDVSFHGGLPLAPSEAYLTFSFNDDDRHSSGGPAVFGW